MLLTVCLLTPSCLFAADFKIMNDILLVAEDTSNSINGTEFLDDIFPQSLVAPNRTNTTLTLDPMSCGRVNIMGNIVQDSAPYLFPFIIEYSLIGAAVIYVMWKHIGRNPR